MISFLFSISWIGMIGFAVSILICTMTLHLLYKKHKSKPKHMTISGEIITSCPVIINNQWYDLAEYLNTFSHPGGNKIIQQFQNIDCTQMFNAMHRISNKIIINNILPKYIINNNETKKTDIIDHYNNNEYFKKSTQLKHIKQLFINKVNNIDFPCICGKTSIYTKQCKFGIIDDINYDLNDLPLIIIDYMIQQQIKWKLKPKKYFSSLIIFFTNIQNEISNRQQFEKYVIQCFEILNNFEIEIKSNINSSKIKTKVESIEKDYKLYPLYKGTLRFFGRTFFLATFNKFEKRDARKFDVPTVIFNSVQEFDFIGNEFDIIHKIIAKRLKKYKL